MYALWQTTITGKEMWKVRNEYSSALLNVIEYWFSVFFRTLHVLNTVADFKSSPIQIFVRIFFQISCREINVYEPNGMRHSARVERRPLIAPIDTNQKQMKENFGDHANKTTIAWPLDVSRLMPTEVYRKAGTVNGN